MTYLKEQIESKEKELFLVVTREIENNQGWLMESSETGKNGSSQLIIEPVLDNADIDINLNNSKERINENGNVCNNQSSR